MLDNFENQTVGTEAQHRAAWQPLNTSPGYMPTAYQVMEPQGTNDDGDRVYSLRTVQQSQFKSAQDYADRYVRDRNNGRALSVTEVEITTTTEEP